MTMNETFPLASCILSSRCSPTLRMHGPERIVCHRVSLFNFQHSGAFPKQEGLALSNCMPCVPRNRIPSEVSRGDIERSGSEGVAPALLAPAPLLSGVAAQGLHAYRTLHAGFDSNGQKHL